MTGQDAHAQDAHDGHDGHGMRSPALDLSTATPEQWEMLVWDARPEEIVAALELKMSPTLRARTSAEDLWQEALLQAWRDRDTFRWQGFRAFRRWLVQLALNRLRDAADRESARRRDARREIGAGATLGGANGSGSGSDSGGDGSPTGVAVDSTTPSRCAIRRECVEAVRGALLAVPGEDREVVRLRLLEERSMSEVAAALAIPLSSAKLRLRRGAAVYERELSTRLDRFV